MRETFPTRLLLRFLQATPEELAAIERLFGAQALPDLRQRPPGSQPRQVQAEGSVRAGAQAGSRCEFRKKGGLWEVIFNGGEPFYLQDTLGARYLDHLLHHPNVPITAFELEVIVMPEKGAARSKESIQPESDPKAKREYREALRRLQAERKRAKKAGDQARVRDLDLDIQKLNAVLNKRGGLADTGERARSNVRHAVRLVVEELEDGGPEEKAFAEHLQDCLSTGHECLYSQPQGRIWA